MIDALMETGDLFRYTAKADNPSQVTLLEKEFAEYMGSKYALAVNSAFSAIYLSMLCVGVKPGDQVLIYAWTFAAVPSAVVHAGALPVLVEVGDNLRIDLADFEVKLNGNISAVVISHMLKRTCAIRLPVGIIREELARKPSALSLIAFLKPAYWNIAEFQTPVFGGLA